MQRELVDVTPCTDNCARILEAGEHLVLTVSPGNPYFSVSRLTILFQWAASKIRHVDVVVSDLEMTEATYLARGLEAGKARKKARADVRQMASRIRRARQAAGTPGLRVSEFGDWAGHPQYRRARAYVRQAMQDPAYRALYREGTRAAAKARMPAGWEPTEEQITAGSIHSEKALPFAVNAVGILGASQAVTAYSRPAPHFTYFFTPDSMFRAFPGQGYIGLRAREKEPQSPHPPGPEQHQGAQRLERSTTAGRPRGRATRRQTEQRAGAGKLSHGKGECGFGVTVGEFFRPAYRGHPAAGTQQRQDGLLGGRVGCRGVAAA
ncbi:tRNA-dependent cyclodipeptide synthase [Streptomyces cellulosae]|uniref:tRNA-dependent cyclodipeptide synthase n=1 Tax=Streptomyces cellulosae TaxID=1968 RepID=UPI000689D8C7|nr:tRNA-dependent cyclodipeptide synthase [Streptomyces cellulosae]